MNDINKNTGTIADEAVVALRRCGHYLHHSAGKDSGKSNETLLAALTTEEQQVLAALLQKCLNSWNQ